MNMAKHNQPTPQIQTFEKCGGKICPHENPRIWECECGWTYCGVCEEKSPHKCISEEEALRLDPVLSSNG